jgi:translation initiation factor IF-2
MAKMRVYELSKEVGIQSKDLIIILNQMGAGVKNHMSTVDEEYVAQVRSSFNTSGVTTKRKSTVVESSKTVSSKVKTSTVTEKESPLPKKQEQKPKGKVEQEQQSSIRERATTPRQQPLKKQASTPVQPKPTGQRQSSPVKPGGSPSISQQGSNKGRLDAEDRRHLAGSKGTQSSPRLTDQPIRQTPSSTSTSTSTRITEGIRTGKQSEAPVKPGEKQTKRTFSATPPKGKQQTRPASSPSSGGKRLSTEESDRKQDGSRLGKGRKKENLSKMPQYQKRRPAFKKPKAPQPATNVKSVQIPLDITVKEFAQAIEVSVSDVIKKLISLGVMASINKEIDMDTAILVGEEFGVTVEVAPSEEETLQVEEIADNPESLQPRWPVVTIMGHVDHGKTSLLDCIREANVIASEAGGITQHIGAYQVDINGKKITFLDTPGHEAFTSMRARGAQVTDIAVLVVAADDGVMPQTIEAINHGKAANVPIIVAINKIDKPAVNPDRVKQELTQYGLVPEEWGGDTICVEVSALKKIGIEQLLEMILLVSEMKELKANPNRPAKGTVIEAKLDKGRGPVASVLVQNGTLHLGDTVIAGDVSGKIRALVNDKGKNVTKVGPSEPVEIVGLDDLPEAGDTFYVTDEKLARQLAGKRQQFRREQELKKYQRVKLEDLFTRIKEGEMKELNIILKADVHGSVEAIQQSLEQLSTDEVRVKVIHGGVGAITESDVMLASASEAIIFGFNVRPDPIAKRVAEREDVDLRMYRIIYNIIDDVKKAMEGLLEPEYKEVVLGRAEVRATFKVPKVGTVAGSYVVEGKIPRNSEARVIRDNVVIFEGKIDSLKRFKDDVREVASGFECGIGIERFNDLKEGDVIEAFTNEEIKKISATNSEG